MEERIEELIRQLTLEEKVSLLAGADDWRTVSIPRLGIPAFKVTDGPNGARGSRHRGGPSSACFPVGVALAASWNAGLVERVGAALADEVKAKGAHILLAPTVNIHRSPLAGRNFEGYSEDPYLAGWMATAYIRGLQSQGVGACIKHFVCNDSEFDRMTISSEVSERALHEIYLTPFRMAIREARPWAVMSAYNKLNSIWCSEHICLLRELLKGEWGFDGIVISDWYGTYTANVARGGLDLEMPGPARCMGTDVLQAVQAGELSEAEIDDKVQRLLRTAARVGAFEQPEAGPEQAIDRPEHRRLAREAAAEAIVLLKNDGVLPLDPAKLRTIAVIGENAARPAIMGGGSSQVRPHYAISPLEGIRARAGGGVQTGYELGCPVHDNVPLLDPEWLTTDGSRKGLTLEYFDNPDLSGEAVRSEVTDATEMIWSDDMLAGVDPASFSVRATARLTLPETGIHLFHLACSGRSRLLIDGQELIDTQDRPSGEGELAMQAGRPYGLTAEIRFEGKEYWWTFRLGCVRTAPADAISAAADLAARSDVAVLFAGLTDEWESEGFDRPDMELPGRQVELIEAVAAANPNTVVVLNVGSPLSMGWLDRVKAVVLAWYPGQEAGNAIADVLFGDANPSGKLPTTFPKRLQDNPAYINYPGEKGQVHYGEGIWVGYRYYDKKEVEPLFPFGYGLSYTTFAYRTLTLSAAEYVPGDPIVARVEVQNTGACAGKEVVQLYVRDVESSVARPHKELKGFAKVALEPGETQAVSFRLGPDALAFYDPAERLWVAERGEFEVLVGSSSREIHLTGRFTLRGDLAP